MDLRDLYGRAAAELRRAGALVVTAGAGMGVDSGLPDFRGDRGSWTAYPPYERSRGSRGSTGRWVRRAGGPHPAERGAPPRTCRRAAPLLSCGP